MFSSPLSAHKVIEPGLNDNIVKGAFSATPQTRWNRLQQRDGKYQEVWTIDGDRLNRMVFYGGVPVGEPLLKERDKKRDPLPDVTGNMLLPDIPLLLERTYRTKYGIAIMSIGRQEPATLDGRTAIAFDYTFIDPEYEVETKGEAIAALENGRLYLVAFEAPAVYYFNRDIQKFRDLLKTVSLTK
ncbi:MAG: hypothetical protein V2I43_18685 [Parvularcula sp.]|nr:hypothetical protein [Parvularcula sp.]